MPSPQFLRQGLWRLLNFALVPLSLNTIHLALYVRWVGTLVLVAEELPARVGSCIHFHPIVDTNISLHFPDSHNILECESKISECRVPRNLDTCGVRHRSSVVVLDSEATLSFFHSLHQKKYAFFFSSVFTLSCYFVNPFDCTSFWTNLTELSPQKSGNCV